jgi:hypothetical protein
MAGSLDSTLMDHAAHIPGNAVLNRRAFVARLPLLAAGFLQAGNCCAGVHLGRLERASFNVRRFGAKGNGRTQDTRALQRAIEAAGREGGCVYFPPGQYLCGTLRLLSHVTLHLENGATLIAAPERADFDDFEVLNYNSYSDQETTDFNYALIRGRDLTDVAILGPGRIDMARKKRGGPKPIALKLCRGVLVRDLTIENAPNYNVSLLGCDFVDILGVTIRNGYCDGIDPDCCRQVRIANCAVESWDDAIVPKASPALGYLRATEHVTVTNCVLSTACNALKLGTESSGGFKDILFQNCSVFSDPSRWGGRRADSGLSLETVDGASLERVAVSNIVMHDVCAPVFVRLANRGRRQAKPVPQHLRDVSISDIVATGATWASSITGVPGFPVSGLTLRNLRVTTRGRGKAEWAAQPVPEREGEYPDAGRFGDLPAYGLYCRHVDNLALEGIHLAYEEPEGRPAVVLDDVANADLRTLAAKPPGSDQPVVRFHNVRESFVQGCRALAGTKTWAVVDGAHTSQFREAGNDFGEAMKSFELDSDVPAGAVMTDSPQTRRSTP